MNAKLAHVANRIRSELAELDEDRMTKGSSLHPLISLWAVS